MSADPYRWPDSTDILGKLRATEAALHRAHLDNDQLRAVNEEIWDALEVEIARNEAKAGWVPCRVLRRILGAVL